MNFGESLDATDYDREAIESEVTIFEALTGVPNIQYTVDLTSSQTRNAAADRRLQVRLRSTIPEEQTATSFSGDFVEATFVAADHPTNPNLPVLTVNALKSLDDIARMRAELGAELAQAGRELETLNIERENLSAAVSRIMDADMATETAEFSRTRILVDSGAAMLAQANITAQRALQLIA